MREEKRTIMIEEKVKKGLMNTPIPILHLEVEAIIKSVTIELLPTKQRIIYDSMVDGPNALSDIYKKAGMSSGSVSTQLREMTMKCNLVKYDYNIWKWIKI